MPWTSSTRALGGALSTRHSSSESAGRLAPAHPRAIEHEEKRGNAPNHVLSVERISAVTPPLPSLLSRTLKRPSATTTPVDGLKEPPATAAAAMAAAAAEAKAPA